MLYEIKLTVDKVLDSGEQKPVKEHYIVDAETHGDAERIGFELYPNTNVDVVAVYRSDIREIINNKEEEKPFFKATVIDVFTEDDGREKETKYQMLVCAKDIMEATNLMKQYLEQGYDMRLDALKRVKIIDYIKYES